MVMTPEEKAVIEAARAWKRAPLGIDQEEAETALWRALEALDAPLPQWLPATLADCRAGDRMRIGQEETDVLFANLQLWHADVSDPYRPKSWYHEELVLDLSANPGRRNYPPDLACEILCDAERAATLALQRSLPGTTVVSSEVN